MQFGEFADHIGDKVRFGEQRCAIGISGLGADARRNIAREKTQSFNSLGVNISQANCRSLDDNKAINTFQFSVSDLEQLKTVMRALQRIDGVYSVSRM